MKRKVILATALILGICNCLYAQTRKISKEQLLDKINGYWIGQLAGNYMGFPFETVFDETPCPFLVDRYYSYKDDESIKINRDDWRSFTSILCDALEGAYSDDDTDIEFVTLHAVEKYGLGINYAEITEMWKKHINRKIWVANYNARKLMDKGMIAPETGSKKNNPCWYMIDPQLVNEIWSVFYPGMTKLAAQKAKFGAKITNDDWGTHATEAYAVIYSAAFFETDVNKLVDMAYNYLPANSPYTKAMKDVIDWHKKYPDWRDTRKMIHKKYRNFTDNGQIEPSIVSSMHNGLCGIMAILYGDGDYMKTVGIAVSAGYDCDNQSATCGGAIAVMNGSKCIPESLTKSFLPAGRKWDKPFNDQYINYTRDNLPIVTKISDIVERISTITEQAIIDNGGKKISEDGKVYYLINCDF